MNSQKLNNIINPIGPINNIIPTENNVPHIINTNTNTNTNTNNDCLSSLNNKSRFDNTRFDNNRFDNNRFNNKDEIKKIQELNNQQVYNPIDKFNNHFFINRYKLILQKILREIKNINNILKGSLITYNDNDFDKKSVHEFKYKLINSTIDLEKTFKNYNNFLHKISIDNGPPYFSIVELYNNNILIETPNVFSLNLNNNSLYLNSIEQTNILFLISIATIYKYNYLIENFKVVLLKLDNPINELNIKLGDLEIILKNVSIIPFIVVDKDLKFEISYNNYELNTSLNNIYKNYIKNNFIDWVLPLSDNDVDVNPYILITAFIISYFKQYTNICSFNSNFDIKNSESMICKPKLFKSGNIFKRLDKDENFLISLDRVNNDFNTLYLFNINEDIIEMENFNKLILLKKESIKFSPKSNLLNSKIFYHLF